METDTVWTHIHSERRALADLLAGIDEAQWEHDTLCPGWTVKDIAAHVISNPQIGWRHLGGMAARNLGRSYNAMIAREVVLWAREQTPATVLGDFERYAGSVRRVPVTTTIEPLLDVLVHTQDILRPLGLRHEMPAEAAVVAADRARLHARLMGWSAGRRVRMVATDIDWTRGRGPTVEGPIQELLMLTTGRAPDPALTSGDGLALLAG